MKRIAAILAVAVLLGAVGFVLFRMMSDEQIASAGVMEVSQRTADILQKKIDHIRASETSTDAASQEIEVSEAELESYVLFSLREKIPVQMDSIDVQLGEGTVGSDAQVTFSKTTGNPVVDALIGGTHNLFVKGRLSGSERTGKFDLEEIRVDGIPVPKVLIETLFNKYVKPEYPEADLKEPFELPWGIDQVTLAPGKATIRY
jgi:hypothetical protein